MPHSIIISAARTPLGSFQGALSSVSTAQLGGVAIAEAVARANVSPADVQEVFVGCVLPAGIGQAPARQAMLAAGLPPSVSALTLNKVCGSGLKAVMLADQTIRAGDIDLAVAGGMESMSNAPYYLPKARTGYRMGNGELIDGMIADGLWDPYKNCHMGIIGELCASTHQFTREQQDAFAAESYRRAQAAIRDGLFRDEIAPVTIPQKKGESLTVRDDEEPGRGNIDKFPSLRPVFDAKGTITAANASSINDGAAALVIASEARAKTLGGKGLARIVAQATFSQAPEWFTTAPAGAITRVCERAGVKVGEIDLFEINEAFACVALHAIKECGLDPKRVNVHGGAIALGHPIGASGARILTTLLYALRRYDKRLGLATLCNGGGEATALLVERL
ncbi:MAG: acetyl-CoA C-acetyltransferase [Deltaproteobacteria bacterium]|nr:acetyl-CoA C-acetyltransferase [Deltaproteobacteria bacterium]